MYGSLAAASTCRNVTARMSLGEEAEAKQPRHVLSVFLWCPAKCSGEFAPWSVHGHRVKETPCGLDGPAIGELAFVGDALDDRSMRGSAGVHPVPPGGAQVFVLVLGSFEY
jgi:hypothetical protein